MPRLTQALWCGSIGAGRFFGEFVVLYSPGFLSKALYGERERIMSRPKAHSEFSRHRSLAVPGRIILLVFGRDGTIILAVPGHNPLPTVKGDDVMLCSTVIVWTVMMSCSEGELLESCAQGQPRPETASPSRTIGARFRPP